MTCCLSHPPPPPFNFFGTSLLLFLSSFFFVSFSRSCASSASPPVPGCEPAPCLLCKRIKCASHQTTQLPFSAIDRKKRRCPVSRPTDSVVRGIKVAENRRKSKRCVVKAWRRNQVTQMPSSAQGQSRCIHKQSVHRNHSCQALFFTIIPQPVCVFLEDSLEDGRGAPP